MAIHSVFSSVLDHSALMVMKAWYGWRLLAAVVKSEIARLIVCRTLQAYLMNEAGSGGEGSE